MALNAHLGEVGRRLYQPECAHSRKRAVEWRHKDLVPETRVQYRPPGLGGNTEQTVKRPILLT